MKNSSSHLDARGVAKLSPEEQRAMACIVVASNNKKVWGGARLSQYGAHALFCPSGLHWWIGHEIHEIPSRNPALLHILCSCENPLLFLLYAVHYQDDHLIVNLDIAPQLFTSHTAKACRDRPGSG